MRLLRPDGAAVGFLVLAVALVAPTGAAATVRYTSPGGTSNSGTCTDPAGSCSIAHLFSVAASGDELVLKPGSYGSPSAPLTAALKTNASNLSVHGTRGAPARIFSSFSAAPAVDLRNGTSNTVSDVEIQASNSAALFLGNGTAQRVAATGTFWGCQTGTGGSYVDSFCRGTNPTTNGFGIEANNGSSSDVTYSLSLRNVTAIGTHDGISVVSGSHVTWDVTLSNVIVDGTPDINALNGLGNGLTVHVGYSNFQTSNTSGGATIDTTPGHNQTTTPPVFIDAAHGNFHEAAGSPTIDKGATSALNGGFDWDGLPRVFGAGTDIGADEFQPPVPVTGPATGVTATGAHLGGTLTPNGAASYHFQFGPTSSYGKSTTAGSASGSTPQSVTATLTGLTEGATYHYRLVATNGYGTRAGADRTFTTTLTSPTLSKLKASRKVFRVARGSTPLTGVTSRRHKRGTTFSFRLDKAATVTVRIERKLRGRRVKRRCRRASRKLRRRPKCTRYVRKATLNRTGHAGLNKIRFSGRVRGKALRPGRYRATFRASNSAGKSKRARISFRIVRR